MTFPFKRPLLRLFQIIAVTLIIGSTLPPVYAINGVPPYPAVVPLNALTGASTGFRVDGHQANLASGNSVAGIGDFNHDGVDDVAIGMPSVPKSNPPENHGAVCVEFGRDYGVVPVFPDVFGSAGLLCFKGSVDNEKAGIAVGAAGDVNADGIPDLVIGTVMNRAYVVFGSTAWQAGTSIDLATLTVAQGFRIDGPANSGLGSSVASAGDFNGDEIADVLIGAPGWGSVLEGSACVIFGHKTTVPPNNQPFPAVVDVTLPAFNGQTVANIQNGGYVNGFRMDGMASDDNFGIEVRRAGKFNNDAYDDVIVGAWTNDWNGTNSGAAYVILGRPLPIPNNGVLTMNNVNVPGVLTLTGATASDFTGRAVAGGGDWNAYIPTFYKNRWTSSINPLFLVDEPTPTDRTVPRNPRRVFS